ncbi:hypothetical protein AB0H73_10085 [Streptomyces olivoreticuli]
MNKIDTHPAPLITLRQHLSPHGETLRWTLFVTGWRVGTYKTEKGVHRAVERWKAELANPPSTPHP